MNNIKGIISLFGNSYSNSINEICKPLMELKIQFVSYQHYLFDRDNYPQFDHDDNDLLSYYIDGAGCKKFDEFNAYIVYNEEVYDELQITEQELYAGIAHELGHMADYILRENCLADEFYADAFCKELGLSVDLVSLIRKLIKSKKYTDYQCNTMLLRIMKLEE